MDRALVVIAMKACMDRRESESTHLGVMASAKVTIVNRLGLHARPAMVFVETAMKFKADITVRRIDQSEAVDGKSIMQMMMLAATQGTEIEICASNSDCDEAVKELVALVDSKFQEE